MYFVVRGIAILVAVGLFPGPWGLLWQFPTGLGIAWLILNTEAQWRDEPTPVLRLAAIIGGHGDACARPLRGLHASVEQHGLPFRGTGTPARASLRRSPREAIDGGRRM